MATRLRPATAADAAFLAWVMLTASRGHVGRGAWDLFVGAGEHDVLAYLARLACSPEPSFCSWRGFLLAEVEGRPAGALCGYDAAAPGMADPDAACVVEAAALGWPAARLLDGGRRLDPFERCLMPPEPGSWVVEWVATLPEHRRHGVARRLLDAVLEAGWRRGHRLSQLTLFVGNDDAQRTYERAGFVAVEDRCDPSFAAVVGCPGLRRMTRPL